VGNNYITMSNFQSNNNRDKTILYKDSPLIKIKNKNGELMELTNSEALAQAIQIWVASSKGEKIRSNSGGYLTFFIGKPVSEENARRIDKNIREGLEYEFTPSITITDLQVIPDKEKLRYVITLKGYNTDFNVGVNTVAVIDAS
jgi:hypothetical protein